MSYQDAQPHAAKYEVLDGTFPPQNPNSLLVQRLRECKEDGCAALIPQVFPTLKILWQQLSN